MKTLAKNNKGFALAFSLLLLLLIILFVDIFVAAANSGLTNAGRIADIKRAYYAADAGLADGLLKLKSGANANVNNAAYAVGPKNGSYVTTLVSDGAGIPTYTITSTGTYGNASKQLQLKVKAESFSRWAYLSNTESHPVYGPLWWITGMNTYGPVFSNGQFNMFGSPYFDGAVSQVNPAVNYFHGGPPLDNPTFHSGLTLGATGISWPVAGMLNSVSTLGSNASGLLLTGDASIAFQSNGTINVTNAARGWVNQNTALPANGVIYVKDGNATVKGTVKGQATVGTNRTIYINGHLAYNTDPRITPSSTDVLGLVANNDITVTTTAPNNLEIDAVLMALTGSFQVDRFWENIRGNMVQYGGLINNVSGPTGVFDPASATLFGGYNQLQFYDNRLQGLVPPGFIPATDNNGMTILGKVSIKEL